MLRRISAFLFVLMVAGNVWAGICGCFDGAEHQDPCCKREYSAHDYFSAKPCCDEACVTTGTANLPRTHADTAIKLPVPANEVFPIADNGSIPSYPDLHSAEIAVHFPEVRLKFPRPPNLYLKHHSFRI